MEGDSGEEEGKNGWAEERKKVGIVEKEVM